MKKEYPQRYYMEGIAEAKEKGRNYFTRLPPSSRRSGEEREGGAVRYLPPDLPLVVCIVTDLEGKEKRGTSAPHRGKKSERHRSKPPVLSSAA